MAANNAKNRLSGRTAMTARLLFKALTVRKTRVAVAVASIMVGAAVISALSSLYLDISIKMSEELRTYGANFFVGPDPAQGKVKYISDDAYQEVLQSIPQDKLVGASPFLYGVVRLDLGNAVLAGVDFAGLRKVSPYWQVEGSWIGVAFDDRNCMVGRNLAKNMELNVGSTVTVINEDTGFRTELTVKGIIETGEAEDEQMFVNLSLARKIFEAPGQSDFAMLSIIARGDEADALADTINTKLDGVEARPIRKISQSEGQILGKIDGLMALVAATILIITTLCVNTTLTAMVVERAPEIGLQKALGATHKAIIRQFLSETVLLCAAGVVLGLAFGFAFSQLLGQAVFNSWVTFRPVVAPVTIGISLAAAVIAAVVPIRRAIAVVPARVLKGE